MPNLERLRQARKLLAEVPEHKVDLNSFFNPIVFNLCGSLACGLGHLAKVKAFGMQRDGLEITYEGKNYSSPRFARLGQAVFDLTFEDSSNIFGARCFSWLDDELIVDPMSDKQLLMARLDRVIEELTIKLEDPSLRGTPSAHFPEGER